MPAAGLQLRLPIGVSVAKIRVVPVSAAAVEPDAGGWLRRTIGYCTRHRREVTIAMSAAVVGAVISAIVPLLIRHVIDTVTSSKDAHSGVAAWVVALVVLAALQFGTTFARRYSAGRL